MWQLRSRSASASSRVPKRASKSYGAIDCKSSLVSAFSPVVPESANSTYSFDQILQLTHVARPSIAEQRITYIREHARSRIRLHRTAIHCALLGNVAMLDQHNC
jgi:hypothetical protein